MLSGVRVAPSSKTAFLLFIIEYCICIAQMLILTDASYPAIHRVSICRNIPCLIPLPHGPGAVSHYGQAHMVFRSEREGASMRLPHEPSTSAQFHYR